VKLTKDMLDLAKHIVNSKSGDLEPEKFEDHYEAALIDLINKKRNGQPMTAKARPAVGNVVNLMDALRASLGQEQAPKTAKKPKKAAGQKEMLLPIDGKKPAKEGAAKKSASKPQRRSAWPTVPIYSLQLWPPKPNGLGKFQRVQVWHFPSPLRVRLGHV
jgi:DNA end-binding protein Ku